MKLILLLLPLIASGCLAMRYERRGDVVRFHAISLFADDKVAKLAIDRVTKTTSTGLSIGTIESEVNSESLDHLTESVITGVVRGLK